MSSEQNLVVPHSHFSVNLMALNSLLCKFLYIKIRLLTMQNYMFLDEIQSIVKGFVQSKLFIPC